MVFRASAPMFLAAACRTVLASCAVIGWTINVRTAMSANSLAAMIPSFPPTVLQIV
jgi:hypothetical protein